MSWGRGCSSVENGSWIEWTHLGLKRIHQRHKAYCAFNPQDIPVADLHCMYMFTIFLHCDCAFPIYTPRYFTTSHTVPYSCLQRLPSWPYMYISLWTHYLCVVWVYAQTLCFTPFVNSYPPTVLPSIHWECSCYLASPLPITESIRYSIPRPTIPYSSSGNAIKSPLDVFKVLCLQCPLPRMLSQYTLPLSVVPMFTV